jgi:hypothetical protein
MKRYNYKFLQVIMLIVVLSACSKKKEGIETLIPNDATVVVAINGQQLMNKMATNGISVDNLEDLLDLDSASAALKPAKSFWSMADSSGLDLNQPLYIVISQPTDITQKYGMLRVVAAIADQKKVIKFLKEGDATIEEKGGIQYANMDDEKIYSNSQCHSG